MKPPLLSVNFPYDRDPNNAETWKALDVLRPSGIVITSHASLDDYDRLRRDYAIELWHIRLKGSRGWFPDPVDPLRAVEWPGTRSPADAIEWCLTRGITPWCVLWNEPDLELVPEWQAENMNERWIALDKLATTAHQFIDQCESEWPGRVRYTSTPLSQGGPPDRFEWWWKATRWIRERCHSIGEHCYTDGRQFDDPEWGGRFRHIDQAGKLIDLLEVNDNGALYAADPVERASHLADYYRWVAEQGGVRSLSYFAAPGSLGQHPSWWDLTLETALALSSAEDAMMAGPVEPETETEQEEEAMPTGGKENPWEFFTAGEIAAACQVSEQAVLDNWPHIAYALDELGLWDRATAIAAASTTAIETAHTFAPVRESFWNSEEWRRQNLRYYPYYGRGYVQLTWEDNYRAAGKAIGVDLVSEPDRALEPSIAAWNLAYYFRDHASPNMQELAGAALASGDWAPTRPYVQGGMAGWDEYAAHIDNLVAYGDGAPGPDRVIVPDPAPPPEPDSGYLATVLEAARSRFGDPYVWGAAAPGGFDCSGFVQWCYRQAGVEIAKYTDTIADQTEPTDDPLPGDILLYRYDDPNQPGCRYPHMGLAAGPGKTIEARYPYGVGEYEPLDYPMEFRKAVAGEVPEVDDGTEELDVLRQQIGELKTALDTERTRLGVAKVDYADAIEGQAVALAVAQQNLKKSTGKIAAKARNDMAVIGRELDTIVKAYRAL